MCVCVCTCVCVYMFVCVCVPMHVCAPACVHVCRHVCPCVCKCDECKQLMAFTRWDAINKYMNSCFFYMQILNASILYIFFVTDVILKVYVVKHACN